MVAQALVAAAAVMVLSTVWYWWFRRLNRRRAMVIVGRLERAFRGRGRVSAIHWKSPSRFHIDLLLLPTVFRGVSLLVEMLPRQSPLGWLISRAQRSRETMVFEADLDSPPRFNLEVHNHRWRARPQGCFPEERNWELEPFGPFMVTTREGWQQGRMGGMMRALVASRQCDIMTVCFRPASPHLSVIIPLDSPALGAPSEADILDVLRELATEAASARF